MTNREFSTGSRRDSDDGKPPFSKLMWTALEEVAQVHKYGDDHYGVGNWRKGQPLTSTIDSAIRHLQKTLKGKDYDSRSKRLHAAHAAWNCLLVVHQQLYPDYYAELDDRIDDFGDWINERFAATDLAKGLEKGRHK
jgi:hypothetical protein